MKPFAAILALLFILLPGPLPASAAAECQPVMGASRAWPATGPLALDACPDALLASLFARQPPPPGYAIAILGFHRYANPDDGTPEAVVEFRLVPPDGHGFGPDRRVCPHPAARADMQVQFTFDAATGRWIDLDSRGGMEIDTLCDVTDYWSRQDIADLGSPPHFRTIGAGERQGVHDVAKGDPERKAILDAVRAANADLNSRVAIVFIVELLRSDGRNAYFRGQVRQKSDGRPVRRDIWGPCEQEPADAVLEAWLEKRGGRWQALKANRCADDVFFSNEEAGRLRLFLMED